MLELGEVTTLTGTAAPFSDRSLRQHVPDSRVEPTLFRRLFGRRRTSILIPSDTWDEIVAAVHERDPLLADELANYSSRPFSETHEWLDQHFPLVKWGSVVIWTTPDMIRNYPIK